MAIDTTGWALPKPQHVSGKETVSPAERARRLDQFCAEQRMLCCTCHRRMTREPGFPSTATLGHDKAEPMGAKKRDNFDNLLGAQCWECNYKQGSTKGRKPNAV
jgi:hypothetical protein